MSKQIFSKLLSGALFIISVLCLNLTFRPLALAGTICTNIPQAIKNLTCDAGDGCGPRCGRLWINTGGGTTSNTVNIDSSSGTTAVNTYGVVQTCSSGLSSATCSANVYSSDAVLGGRVSLVHRAAISSTYSIGCVGSPAPSAGLYVNNAVAYSRCGGVSCDLSIQFGSVWSSSCNTSSTDGSMTHPITISVSIPVPPPGVMAVSGNTTVDSSPKRFLPGDTIKFTHTGSATCSGGDCTSTVKFSTGAGPSSDITFSGTASTSRSLSYSDEKGTKSITPIVETHTIRQADLGKKLCRRVTWSFNKPDGSGNASGRGTEACIDIPKPTLTVTATATTKATNASNNEVTTMEPGQRVTFTHSLGLSRSGNYTGDVTTRFTPAFGTSNSITHMPGAGSYKDLTVEYGTIPATGPLPDRTPSTSDTIAETHTATQDDVGKQICRRISYSLTTPNATTRNSINVTTPPNLSGNTTEACVSVPYNYTLTPTISAGGGLGDQPLPPGTSITDIVSTVSNSGPTKSRPTQWVVSHFVLNPGQTLSNTGLGSAQQNSSQPSSHFNPNGSWQNFASGNNKVFMLDPETISNNNFTIPQNSPIGSKYCFALSIQPYIHSSANWSHSRPICIIVSKSPTTQIHGSSLMVPNGAVEGRSVDFLDDVNNASSTRRRYASWVEYDILASRNIVNVTSNAGTLIGNHDVSQSSFWHQLTFANTPNLGNFGSGLTSGRSAWIYEYFNKQATQAISNNYTATSLSLSSITLSNSITYRYQKSSTSLTLSSNSNLFNVPSGKSLVIVKEDGDLIINSNIRYNNSVSRASDIPQVIIIVRNGNIIINPDVTNVDAWLVALGNNNSQGHLKTCNQDTVSVSTCNNPLRVNGPVLVDYLDLLRTYGAERPSNTLEDPAEIFNLRPDAYIWSMSQTNSQPVFSTTLVDEVPARY